MTPIGTIRIPSQHPCLPGHFPGNPIVPGSVLLDRVIELIRGQFPGYASAGARRVKFFAPVLPEEDVTVEMMAVENGPTRIDFRCLAGEKLIAAGRLDLAR